MQAELTRVLRNWRDEHDSAELYAGLAQLESDAQLGRVFAELAAAERAHADFWAQRLHALGGTPPRRTPSLRVRSMLLLARHFGVAFVMPQITTRELADHRRYQIQDDARAAGLSRQERGHAAVLRRAASIGRQSEGSGVERLGNDLRAAVLGATDGLASNFCLIAGVAGAGVSAAHVLLTAVAGLVAGACSMALGEWLSVTNAREMGRTQVDADARELHGLEWQADELALLHRARGLAPEEAVRETARGLAGDPATIDALVREERVLAVGVHGNDPLRAAISSFVLFAAGACVPLLPWLALEGRPALLASTACALGALFGLGTLTSFFTGRGALYSGFRHAGVGALAAAVTYGIGHLAGAALG